ncbi:Hsp20/alpha crystallin family protein [Leptolyngbya ohadii]|uniref:Hsp20/alpha crystallin family protein n=1 Tax=Leptolyngbya ohadii TaxID=1962290 RepID=UPI000B5A0B3E|nr:Hsp20/alpha crystallin family protein [Leptolyngbya ohadii]
MSLMQWRPRRDLSILRQQMDHLFDDLLSLGRDFPPLPKINIVEWAPAVELRETDGEMIVKVQVPGISAKDLDVHVSEDAVSISGEHREEKRTEEKGVLRSEFQYGQFQRVIALPVPIKHEQVKSEFKDGVLTLTLPKVQIGSRTVVRVNVDTGEIAREALTEKRQAEAHLQDTMRARAAAELQMPDDKHIQEAARERGAETRQHEEHLQDTMRTRAATEMNS